MKIIYTVDALRDLDAISTWLQTNYPGTGAAVERRIRLLIDHLARWPESMRRSRSHPTVRIAPLGRYPYKIFYRAGPDRIEILHIHHAARKPWDQESDDGG